MEEIVNTIKLVINKTCDIDLEEINEESSVVDDLCMNSIEILMMIVELEKKYGIKFETRDLRSIVTIKDIADYIVKKNENN